MIGALKLAVENQSSLRVRVLRGGAWLLAADCANRGISVLKVAIVARVLGPNDFGLMGLATLVLSWFDYFSETGFSTALIRKPDTADVQPYLGTFWTVQAMRGTAICILVFASAPLTARLFHTPEMIPVVRAISFLALLRGLANPAVIYLRRELQLQRETVWRVGGTIAGLIVAIPVAFRYRNVWALVASTLMASLVELGLSYYLVPHRPRIELDWRKARELMRFGKWIFWANSASYLSLYSDSWVVGRFLGSTPIGYYQMAQQLGMTPTAQIRGHIAAAILPAFSKLQGQHSLRDAFLRSIRFVSTALLPLGAIATVFAPIFVRLLLGERWMPICPLLQLLVWSGILTALGGVSTAFLEAANQPDVATRAAFLKFFGFAALFYPLLRSFGVVGVACASLLSTPISFIYQYVRIVRLLGWAWDVLLVFAPAVVVSLPALVAPALGVSPHSAWASAALAIAAGLSCLFLAMRQLFVSVKYNE